MKLLLENFKVKGVDMDGEDHDQTAVIFATDGRRLELRLTGDCCSSSYFESNSQKDLFGLLGENLLSIESTDSFLSDGRRDEDTHVKYHALVLRTDAQSITVDWRNESNGYYDGECVVMVCNEVGRLT